MTVSDIKPGLSFCVDKVNLNKEMGKRLADMGFTKGAQGVVLRKALFGGPLQIRILGYEIAIRRNEALGINVKVLEK